MKLVRIGQAGLERPGLIGHAGDLLPGDLTNTGTPPGVCMGRKPLLFLNVGKEIELGIEKLGRRQHQVIAPDYGR